MKASILSVGAAIAAGLTWTPLAHAGNLSASTKVSGPITLVVQGADTQIQVAQGAQGVAVIEVSDTKAKKVELRSDNKDGTRLRAWFDDRDMLPQGKVRVQLPRGSHVDLSTASGDLVVKGVGGNVRVRSASGEVTLEDVKDVDANVVSGDLKVSKLSGGLRADVVSGDVKLSTAGQADPRVELRAVSGDATFTGLCGKGCELRFKAVSGDVDLKLDAKSSFGVHFSSFSGDVSDKLGLSITRREKSGVGGGERLDGSFGARDGQVECKTHSGDLKLRR